MCLSVCMSLCVSICVCVFSAFPSFFFCLLVYSFCFYPCLPFFYLRVCFLDAEGIGRVGKWKGSGKR